MISRRILRQLFVFGLVGITATVTHYLVALFCHEGLKINLYVCNLIGYSSAVAVSFFGHGRYTFQITLSQDIFRRFVVVSVATFLASEGMLAALENSMQLSHRISLAVVVLTIPVITFLLNKMWVFRHPVQ
ncbi:MAG: GtrA family protein [Gammaproteobacteria bacterium]|nr:GtrA family protein [Gammaproteobacteria bacterium]